LTIYGHALDALWAKEANHPGRIVRYADDAVILKGMKPPFALLTSGTRADRRVWAGGVHNGDT
jgi:hypothetical protein